jgi:excisionase family DNA binding protein
MTAKPVLGGGALVFHAISDVCAMAKASRATVYQAIKRGELRSVKRGRRRLVSDPDYRDWASSWSRFGGEAA